MNDNPSTEQIEIMKHTLANGVFCGDSKDMQSLCDIYGFMVSAGRKSFVPDEYFRLTPFGKIYLNSAK